MRIDRPELDGPLQALLDALAAQERSEEALAAALIRHEQRRNARLAAVEASDKANEELGDALAAAAAAKHEVEAALARFGRVAAAESDTDLDRPPTAAAPSPAAAG